MPIYTHVMQNQNQNEKPQDCYEFLDLSDVDDNERTHIASTLYSSDNIYIQTPWIINSQPDKCNHNNNNNHKHNNSNNTRNRSKTKIRTNSISNQIKNNNNNSAVLLLSSSSASSSISSSNANYSASNVYNNCCTAKTTTTASITATSAVLNKTNWHGTPYVDSDNQSIEAEGLEDDLEETNTDYSEVEEFGITEEGTMSPYSSNSQKQTSQHQQQQQQQQQQQHTNIEQLPQHHQQPLMPQQIPLLPTRNYGTAYVAPPGGHRNPMYHMQMIGPNNIYVGNQIAPHNIQYISAAHGVPLHMSAQTSTASYLTTDVQQPSTTSISSTGAGLASGTQEIPSIATPLAIQYPPPIAGRGNGRGRGRGGRMGNNLNNGRREYIPRPHQSYHQQQQQQQQSQHLHQQQNQQQSQQQTQQHHHHQQQQQQQQQQQPQSQQNQELVPQTLINSQQIPLGAPAGYTQFFANPYQPVYFTPGPSGHLPHQTAAQHATGAPLYVSMYPHQMYYPNMMYQTLVPPEYLVDDKGEEVPGAAGVGGPPTAIWPPLLEMDYADGRGLVDGNMQILDEYQTAGHDQQQPELLIDGNQSAMHHMQQSQLNQHITHHQQLPHHQQHQQAYSVPHHHHHQHHQQQLHHTIMQQHPQSIQNPLDNQQQSQSPPQQQRPHVLNPNVPNFVNHSTHVNEVQQLEQIQFMSDEEQSSQQQQLEYFNDDEENDTQYVLDDYQEEQTITDDSLAHEMQMNEYEGNYVAQQQEQDQQQLQQQQQQQQQQPLQYHPMVNAVEPILLSTAQSINMDNAASLVDVTKNNNKNLNYKINNKNNAINNSNINKSNNNNNNNRRNNNNVNSDNISNNYSNMNEDYVLLRNPLVNNNSNDGGELYDYKMNNNNAVVAAGVATQVTLLNPKDVELNVINMNNNDNNNNNNSYYNIHNVPNSFINVDDDTNNINVNLINNSDNNNLFDINNKKVVDNNIAKLASDKLIINDDVNVKQNAWNTKTSNVGSTTTNINKKSTASVAVSAIPNKEFINQNMTSESPKSQQQSTMNNNNNSIVQDNRNMKLNKSSGNVNDKKTDFAANIQQPQQQHQQQSRQQQQQQQQIKTNTISVSTSTPTTNNSSQSQQQQQPMTVPNNLVSSTLNNISSSSNNLQQKTTTTTDLYKNDVQSKQQHIDSLAKQLNSESSSNTSVAVSTSEKEKAPVAVAAQGSWASLFVSSPSVASASSIASSNTSLASSSSHLNTDNVAAVRKTKPQTENKNQQQQTSENSTMTQTASPVVAPVPVAMTNVAKKPNTTVGILPKIGDSAGVLPKEANEYSMKLGNFLAKYQIDTNSISLQPRGLINRSNYCYINATLQALISCPPFYHLMRALPKPSMAARAANGKSATPVIDAMAELFSEFSYSRVKNHREKDKKDIPELNCDSPFEPIVIHKMLPSLSSDLFQVEGRQEDAEEFLGSLLNRLNDEMLALMKLVQPKNEVQNIAPSTNITNGDANGEVIVDDSEAGGDDWQVICNNRNKGTITRATDFGRSPISDIFGGKFRSRVQREGDHSTDNIEPFLTLQLDIEKAASVKDALEILVGRDQLEGVTCAKTHQEIAAWQQTTLEELPIVLILHLKCFDYQQNSCKKIMKSLDFPIELKIDTKIMSSKAKYSQKQRQYKLFAVVYHDGKEASKGHYITDVYHVGYNNWIRYDDSVVKPVGEHTVLRPRSPRVPYLLYYRRSDTIGNNPYNNNSNSGNNNNNNNNHHQYHHHHKS